MNKKIKLKNYEYLKEFHHFFCSEMLSLQDSYRIQQLEANYLRSYIRLSRRRIHFFRTECL